MAFAIFLGASWSGLAQMVSSGITGLVRADTGVAVSGAEVKVVHVPTNTTYTAVTSETGRFKFTGLRPGGPYTVSATSSSYTVQSLTDVETSLGDDTDVVLAAKSSVVVMEKFVLVADPATLDANAMGASSVLSARRVELQPTSTRSFADLMKTNPFVTVRAFPQVTALGMNNRYNSIMLDGARLNDQFGLASSGIFSLKNPFSLDAIEQFSVSLTPYDVTQSGFAGASINAVSKSGTNEFHGSAYYIYTSYQWQGKDLSGSNNGRRPTPFYERTTGYTLGGPILKDRLFFFLNYEKFSNPSGSPSNPGFTPNSTFLSTLDTQVKALPGGANLGSFGGAGANLDTEEKKLAKIDWNITADHRLTVRYSETDGARPSFNSFNPGTGFSANVTLPGVSNTGFTNGITSLSSSYYTLSVLEKVWAGQIFSNWSPSLKTQLGYSKNDSSSLRAMPATFPELRILNVPGTSTTGAAISTGNAFSLGSEISSQGNGVIVKTQSYNAHAEYTWGKINFKGGFDREESDFDNLFRAGSYGVFAYNYSPTLNVATATPVAFGRNVAQQGFPGTDVSRMEQTGYFLQASWTPLSRLNVVLGLRYDEFGSPIAPPLNAAFGTAFNAYFPGIRNNGTIDGASLLAPRLSFNYSVDEERRMQVRGGVGLFMGRNPWVWISNSYGNAGYGRFAITTPSTAIATPPTLTQYLQGGFSNSDPAFKFDAANPMGTTNLTAAAGSPAINLIQPGLKPPTNLRGNLALDFKVPALGGTFTVEYIYNKQTEAMFYENLNLRVLNGDAQNKPTATSYGADGRLRFATNAAGNGGAGNAPLVTGFGNVLRLRNVTAGDSRYFSLMLDRPLRKGYAYNLAYTRGRATEAQPAGSSTAGSQWSFNHVFNQGAVEVSRSDYEIRDRVQGTYSREFNWIRRLKTVVSLYYEGRSGQPYTYVYGNAAGSSNDLNKDGNGANDLVAVPRSLTDPRFDFSGMTAVQQSAYMGMLQTTGLAKYAGSYAPRNAFTTSWQNRLDLRFSQEVRTVGRVRLEVFADFMNFGSWIARGIFNYVETINASTTNSNQVMAVGGATYTAAGLIRPVVALNPDGTVNFPATSTVLPNSADSRWRIQGGVRLKF